MLLKGLLSSSTPCSFRGASSCSACAALTRNTTPASVLATASMHLSLIHIYPAKLHQTIHGVPVKGTLEQIPELCKRYGIHTILVAIPTLKGSRLNHVIDLCVSTHCAVQMLSDPQLVGSGAPQQGAFRELNLSLIHI